MELALAKTTAAAAAAAGGGDGAGVAGGSSAGPRKPMDFTLKLDEQVLLHSSLVGNCSAHFVYQGFSRSKLLEKQSLDCIQQDFLLSSHSFSLFHPTQ